ncbi:hypothetical protein O6H91_16G060500 [Diphasiastrum complanatum]|uniref:Uncharacterized protein n=1 Tax=Diphasiastrum complanatum TaxID=34168 RepID=A0ACC2BCY2_DIPCM|nr:hypothetical protein O6H91_16G060500 [Diphasiastrum complanatum]
MLYSSLQNTPNLRTSSTPAYNSAFAERVLHLLVTIEHPLSSKETELQPLETIHTIYHAANSKHQQLLHQDFWTLLWELKSILQITHRWCWLSNLCYDLPRL